MIYGGDIVATGNQIKTLIRSHYSDNEDYFNSVVLQVAAHQAKKGHTALAKELKSIVDNERSKRNKVLHLKEYSDLIDYHDVNQKLTDLISNKEIHTRLSRIISEFKNQSKLKKYNLQNRRKVLLVGPPGTGKTMTSSILAAELGLPLGVIMMEKMITKYMGETSVKLRQIFDAIANLPSVYLFDEFDAIGAERERENDVGEMRRVVNSFLQFLEQDNSNSLIIAATNSINVLDKALFRRFDDVIFYELPDESQIESLMAKKLALFNNGIDFSTISARALGLNQSEIVRACENSIKEAIINESKIVDEKLILNQIDERKEIYNRGG